MQIKFRVTYSDGSAAEDATASVADQVAFERTFDRSIATLGDSLRLTDMCWLAWSGIKRKRDVGEFDAWLERVDSVEIRGDSSIVPLETSQPTG